MKKTYLKLAFFFAGIGFFAATTIYAQDIVLGQSVPLSGTNADIGRDMRDGALAVFTKVNSAGGINGRKIQLITLDNANNRVRALENTKELLDARNVALLFGYNSATTSLDALPLIAAKNMALFAPFTGSPSARDHPNVFTVRASYLDESQKLIELFKNIGSSKAVVVYYDDEAGKSNVQIVSAAYDATNKPRTLAVKRNVKLTVADFEPALKDPPHYMLFTTQASVLGDYMQAAQARNANFSVSALSFVNPDNLARSYGQVARGAIVSQVVPAPYGSALFKNNVIKDCARLLKDFSGGTLNYTSLESCIAAKVIVKVIQQIGPNKLTRASLMRGLATAGRIDLDGFVLDYSKGRHGSQYVDISFLSRDSMFQAK